MNEITVVISAQVYSGFIQHNDIESLKLAGISNMIMHNIPEHSIHESLINPHSSRHAGYKRGHNFYIHQFSSELSTNSSLQEASEGLTLHHHEMELGQVSGRIQL